MDNIVFEEELVREEIYKGTFILDGHMNEEEQKNKIFEMMKSDGVSVFPAEELEIGYVGADDNDGLSETQTSDFVVTHVYKKQVPYTLRREEIYTGEYILDGLQISPSEQKAKIVEMMKRDGVEVPPMDEIDIGYVGADDNDGLSETQTSKFVVYHIVKEKVLDESLIKEAEAKKIYDELVELREKIASATTTEEINKLVKKISEIDTKIDALTKSDEREYAELESVVTSLDSEISELEEILASKVLKFESSYEKVKELMVSEDDSEELLAKKEEENERVLAIRKTIEDLTVQLNELKKKKKKAVKDLETAKVLGISASEYIEITSDLRKKKLMDAILDTKGLGEILAKPAKERTTEEKKLLTAARKEILEEVASAKKEEKDESVLKLIEALYGVETEVQLKGKQRVLIIKQSALDNIYKNAKQLPEKVVKTDTSSDYVPAPAPQDMQHVLEAAEVTSLVPVVEGKKDLASVDDEIEEEFDVKDEQTPIAVENDEVPSKEEVELTASAEEERKELKEEFTFFVDIKNQKNVYVRKYLFQRFNLEPTSNESVRINGELCYPIALKDIRYISANADNSYSPYIVRFDSIEFDREHGLKEQFTFFVDLEDKDKIYARKYVFERFGIEKADPKAVRINGELCYAISFENVKEISRFANNNYSPYQVNYDSVDFNINKRNVMINEEPVKEVHDKFTIYIDKNTNKYYVRKNVYDRFNIDDFGLPATIEGVICFEIAEKDAQYILNNANNNYSPYAVEFKKVKAVTIDEDNELYNSVENRGLIDKYTIFRDIDTNKLYVRKPVFDRFNASSIGEEVRIKGVVGYEISESDAQYILSNAQNNYSPYVVDYVNLRVERTNTPKVEEVHEDNKEEKLEEVKIPEVEEVLEEDKEEVIESRGLTDKYTIFRDSQSDRLFAMKPTFDRFNIAVKSDAIKINGITCHEISKDDAEFIRGNVNNSYSPYIVEDKVLPLGLNVEVKKEKVKTPEVEEKKEEIKREEKKVSRGLTDKYTIFRDGQSDRLFAMKPVFDRFNLNPVSDEVRINGVACHEVNNNDADFIRGNANNSYSPYIVEDKVLPLGLDKPQVKVKSDSFGLTDKYTIFRDGQSDRLFAMKPVFDRFNLNPVSDEVRINGVACHEISSGDADFIRGNANNSYSPYIVEDKVLPLGLNSSDKDKIILYRDMQSDRIFANKPVFERFNINEESDAVTINGVVCHEIYPEDALFIVRNSDNKYSPYDIEYHELPLGLERLELNNNKSEDRVMPYDENLANSVHDNYTIYRDIETNKFYAYEDVINRFHLDTTPNVEIDGVMCGEITSEEVNYIVSNANNKYAPYKVNIKNVKVNKMNEIVPEVQEFSMDMPQVLYGPGPMPEVHEVEVGPEEGFGNPEEGLDDVELITLFRDLNDNDQVYASNDTLRRFGITPHEGGTIINGFETHKISRDTDQIINSIAKMSRSPRMVIKYVDVHLEKANDVSKPKPHVEEIIDKITRDLDIRPNDQKRYRASNIKVSKSFRDELKSGNFAYNIIHIVPATIRAGINFFRKLSGKIVTSRRAKRAMSIIEERLDSLSEEELEVLFDEYKGSQLKTDMNNQINPLILDTIKGYGLRKVAKLNDEIRVNYGELFTLLGEIKVLEEEIADENTSKDRAVVLNAQRKKLLEAASVNVRRILSARRDANNLLSSGVHGIEEDFKAVSTKLSYVGLRFGKTNKFDNELQHKLGDFGRSLNTALASGNAEGIVQSFMGLESCYYNNTEIRGSLLGRRSVGSKYYTPVAEQFDYRDDPFVRDLLSTIAISSAAVSAINAYRIHQVESQELVDEVHGTMSDVQKVGEEMAGKKATIQEGMEAEAHQAVLNHANVTERASLDTTGWKFNDAYRAADNAGHAAYNQFGEEVSRSINQVCSDYSQGLITEAAALEKIAEISNNAQATLNEVVQSSLPILKDYAASHPQFDLTAVQESMEYICAHPNAVADMNQAMLDMTNLTDALSSQNIAHLASLSALPSDMASTLVCAASSAALALYVSGKMNGYNRTRNTYSDEIAGMMENYVNGEDVEVDEEIEEEELARAR